MPHEAFFKLSKEKQNNIVECAYNEFANNSYDKTSIFLIAQKAGISRTSFYCYFKDKTDIYNYLMDMIMQPHIKNLKNKKKSFSLFYFAKEMFDYFVSFYDKQEKQFIVSMLKNMNPKNIKYFSTDLSAKSLNGPCGLIINTDNINIKSPYDIYIISFTILCNMSFCLIQYFEGELKKEEAYANFNRTLEILQNGVSLKGGKNDSNN